MNECNFSSVLWVFYSSLYSNCIWKYGLSFNCSLCLGSKQISNSLVRCLLVLCCTFADFSQKKYLHGVNEIKMSRRMKIGCWTSLKIWLWIVETLWRWTTAGKKMLYKRKLILLSHLTSSTWLSPVAVMWQLTVTCHRYLSVYCHLSVICQFTHLLQASAILIVTFRRHMPVACLSYWQIAGLRYRPVACSSTCPLIPCSSYFLLCCCSHYPRNRGTGRILTWFPPSCQCGDFYSIF